MTRILVVEDSRTQAEAAKAILESAGFDVELAPDGEQGLARVDDDVFDLVISDIVMPGISGYELCRSIKANRRRRSTPVVLLTTLNDPMDIIQGLESGADNFITKPYEPDYLIERVTTLLENRALRAVGQGKLKVGVEIMFMGQKFVVTSDKEQILDLLISTFEDIVRTNRSLHETQVQLSAAKAKIEEYAHALEGRVRRSEERYRALMHHANDAIFVLSTDGRFLEINRQAEILYGRNAGELLGRDVSLLSERARATFEKVKKERTVRESGLPIEHDDGSVRLIDFSASTTEIGGEELVLVIVRDVTEQKELERRLHENEKLQAVARLASGAAHDFNNVLMAIQTFATVASRKVAQADEAVRKPIDEILKSSRRGTWLIGQLLAFTRGATVGSSCTDVNHVLRGMEPMLRQLAGEKVDLDFHFGSGPAMVHLEPGHIEQIVMNLVVNARDAMPKGGKIEVGTQSGEFRPSQTSSPDLTPGRYIAITVRDNGEGMSRATASQLFQPFFTTKKKGHGSGLGLALVDTIVHQAGGQVHVTSEQGVGSDFTIYLPVAEKDAQIPAG